MIAFALYRLKLSVMVAILQNNTLTFNRSILQFSELILLKVDRKKGVELDASRPCCDDRK